MFRDIFQDSMNHFVALINRLSTGFQYFFNSYNQMQMTLLINFLIISYNTHI